MRLLDGEPGADVQPEIATLLRRVQALVDGDHVLPADGDALLSQIEAARRHACSGDTAAARARLERFLEIMQALLDAGASDGDDGVVTLDTARKILSGLRCA
jgi:hypothetical protein